jgi:peptidoglycan DL-endopeptidase CwlO
MNKFSTYLAAGMITVAGAGLAATPVLAAGPTNPTTEQQAMPTDTIHATHAHKHGDRMARVEKVQQALNSNGASLRVDGMWGPKTTAALKDYQKAHNLKVTGHMDKATRGQLLKA